MSERDAFGPNLRRARVQRGISLDHLVASTKVSAEFWLALERNDFSRWPTGLYARAHLRTYAAEVGVDPEATVDDFCRWFSQGDRRAERIVREQAALMGHDLRWKDDGAGLFGRLDRRTASAATEEDLPPLAFTRTGRIVAAVVDLSVTMMCAAAITAALPVSFRTSLAATMLVYHTAAMVALGCTPAVWAIETHLVNRHPSPRRAGTQRFLRLLRRA